MNRLNRLVRNSVWLHVERIRFRWKIGLGKSRSFKWIRVGKWTRWRMDYHHLFLLDLSYLLVQIFQRRITIYKSKSSVHYFNIYLYAINLPADGVEAMLELLLLIDIGTPGKSKNNKLKLSFKIGKSNLKSKS